MPTRPRATAPRRRAGAGRKKAATPTAARAKTRRSVQAAAARAVDRVLSSKAAFALLVQKLEAAGWHVERAPGEPPAPVERGDV